MSRHEAGWVPDTTPGYQGQRSAPIISDATIREIDRVAREWPDGIHTCSELQRLEPGRRPCTCGRCGPTDEELAATIGYRLCNDCRAHHFRAYPEFPDEPCMLDDCQCWCMT